MMHYIRRQINVCCLLWNALSLCILWDRCGLNLSEIKRLSSSHVWTDSQICTLVCMHSAEPLANIVDQVWRPFQKKKKTRKGKMRGKKNAPWSIRIQSYRRRLHGPTPPRSSLYLWPVKNDISSWRASISICILLEALRFRAEDISALSRQN